MITNKQLAKKFATKYSLPKRYFGLSKKQAGTELWRFRRLITNVLVSGSSEENTLMASEQIFSLYPNCETLSEADEDILMSILNENGIRFSGRKAANVIDVAAFIRYQEDGIVPKERKLLENMPGVGRHTASIVRALAFDMPCFGVDLHVRRIAKRLGLVGEQANDSKIEDELKTGIQDKNLAAFSRAFVDFGKETCGAQPDCVNCFLSKKCPTALGKMEPTVIKSATEKKSVNIVTLIDDGKYAVVAGSSEKEYTVTVNGAKISCNCKGYRFRRTCSHVVQMVGVDG